MFAPPELEKIHPLGKSPIIAITAPGAAEPIILAESGFITEYLCEHFGEGTTMVPPKWKAGHEGKVAGETPEWLRYQHLLHYAEGSFMPVLLMSFVIGSECYSSYPVSLHRIASRHRSHQPPP
jgi:glutathione S-transferase